MKCSAFSPIGPADADRLKPFFENQRHELCVYSLPSLLVWSSNLYQPWASVADDAALVVGMEYTATYESSRHLILPVSPDRVFTPEELGRIAEDLGFPAYWFVTRDWLDRFEADRVGALFKVEEQTALSDYVYRREDLVRLPGKKYVKKRNLVNQFKREYVLRNRAQVGPITRESAPECVDFLEAWCEQRDCDNSPEEDLACEKMAVINALDHIDRLDFSGIWLRVDGRVSAIGIGSRLTADTGALHFEKAFADIKGLYQYFDSQCAEILFDGLTFINKESDMDLERLAQAKISYHPVKRIPCYKLVLI